MFVLGLLFSGRNPSACLLKSNKIIALVEEERFTRRKQSNLDFPLESVLYCLSVAKIKLAQIDHIAVGWDTSKFDSDHMHNFFNSLRDTLEIRDEQSINWQNQRLERYKS